jgi:hypothetical protein
MRIALISIISINWYISIDTANKVSMLSFQPVLPFKVWRNSFVCLPRSELSLCYWGDNKKSTQSPNAF